LGETDALLVEAKWANRPVGIDILANLERKASVIKRELGERQIRYALCARSGFTSQLYQDARERREVTLFNLPAMMQP
jgi:hypothetical protein